MSILISVQTDRLHKRVWETSQQAFCGAKYERGYPLSMLAAKLSTSPMNRFRKSLHPDFPVQNVGKIEKKAPQKPAVCAIMNIAYQGSFRLGKEQRIMSGKRRDNKNRILRSGESQSVQLPSNSTSRWTPLPLAIFFPLPGGFGTCTR